MIQQKIERFFELFIPYFFNVSLLPSQMITIKYEYKLKYY